jgi:hypothetical protein
MNFNRHSVQPGSHAFLSPSSNAWLNYDEDKLDRVFHTHMLARRGSELHALAAELIRLGVRLPDEPKTLNMYVNDAIGFRLNPEQMLWYSENCYGTADAIGYRVDKLKIADLKTGTTPTTVRQLEVYAALFCLEYRMKPFGLDIELRIYQNNEVHEYAADPVDIGYIMDRIVTLDKRIKALREEAL